MKKHVCLLLFFAMFSASLASCGNAPAETEADTADTTAAETETVAETDSIEGRKAVSDNLPEKDFGGEKYTVIGYDMNVGYYMAEELNGDVVNDAIYNRNVDVAERFNVEVIFQDGGSYSDTSAAVKNSVVAGESVYDLVATHYIQMGIDALNNVYMDFNDVPYIDFEQPWWLDSTTDLLTYKGVTFLAFGEMSLTNTNSASCMFFNKDMAEEYELGNIYDLVFEGKWTKDKLAEFGSNVYKDVNGDGIEDRGDIYGYVISLKSFGDNFTGKPILKQQEDGSFADNYYDEQLVSIVEWLYDLVYNQQFVYSEDAWNVNFDMFVTGNTLTTDGLLMQIGWGLRDSEIDYAIIPTPKWDEKQERYAVSVGGSADALAVLRTAGNLEKIGIVTEAMCAESWKNVVPAYYDISLKYKGARDEESIETLEIIMENRAFDFGVVYGGWGSAGGGAAFWVQEVVGKGSTDITSYYQSKKNGWDSYMGSIYGAFEEYISQSGK